MYKSQEIGITNERSLQMDEEPKGEDRMIYLYKGNPSELRFGRGFRGKLDTFFYNVVRRERSIYLSNYCLQWTLTL